jgi:transcriptional regulator of arginine metabolism
MSRGLRHSLIKRIVQERRIGSQEELVGILQQEGVECTQATLSRDLRDLGVVRKNTSGGPVYLLDGSTSYMDALRKVVCMEILGVRHNGSLVVIRTLSGRAEGVAAYLDQNGHQLILGTVAGDDTVFVAPVDPSTIEDLVKQIRVLGLESKEGPK